MSVLRVAASFCCASVAQRKDSGEGVKRAGIPKLAEPKK
jgi:hypothetical protein